MVFLRPSRGRRNLRVVFLLADGGPSFFGGCWLPLPLPSLLQRFFATLDPRLGGRDLT